ncbi:hypothetical protein FG167_12970 [Lacinutrix sp. WUR7]|uniref:hypothetical protein n=1 Tax=Lacinutrix sp. WUR7 TaxID=2653681 RepID=UPI00193E2C2C|nr:hypothetical protein [Lacinutrix sp. WUR7]QRM90106.1 hypothetical protein FG167_12970 [Lacinutrix sp. WUR7]
MAVDQEKMLQTLYDSLFGVFTGTPPGGEAGSEAEKTVLMLNWPGQAIDMATFANPWSPANPSGSQEALETFSALVDPIPLINVGYSSSGKKVSEVQELVVNATVVPPKPSEEAKKAYKKAKAYLTAMVDGYDDNTGAAIKTEGDSPVYANYKRKKDAYLSASTSFLNQYLLLDMSKPEDQRKWSILGPNLQEKVDTAMNDWIAAQKTKTEDNLATLSQSSSNQVGQLFEDAKNNFYTIQRSSVKTAGDKFHPSYARPAAWFAPAAANTWTDMAVSSEETKIQEHSDFKKYGGGASASWGLWSGSASFSKEEGHESMDKETSDLKISFKYTRVEIDRPWMNQLLYDVGGWNIKQAGPKGSISNGTKDQKGKMMPILPTAFIAVRDLQITAKWGKEDYDLITSKLETKASFGWGPFRISGNYESSSRDMTNTTKFDGTTIKSDGLQIIGWINTVLHESPPE